MPRFGVGVLSGRVLSRHTAFLNSSLGGRHFCSSTAIGMCGLLGRSLRSLTAFVPTWCTRNTSTGRGSSLTKGVFLLCWFCFMTARQIGFVRLSYVTPHIPLGSRPLSWVFNIRVDLAPHRDRHRLGFIVTHSHLWPLANGAHAYVFAYPCFGRCRRRMRFEL